jgi:hypothetical protein
MFQWALLFNSSGPGLWRPRQHLSRGEDSPGRAVSKCSRQEPGGLSSRGEAIPVRAVSNAAVWSLDASMHGWRAQIGSEENQAVPLVRRTFQLRDHNIVYVWQAS